MQLWRSVPFAHALMQSLPPDATSCAHWPSCCPHWPKQLAELSCPALLSPLSSPSDGSCDGSSGGFDRSSGGLSDESSDGSCGGSAMPSSQLRTQLEMPLRHVLRDVVFTSLQPPMHAARSARMAVDQHWSLQSIMVG